MTTISAIIITLNEQRNIARCLQAVQYVADEIIVVDSGSTDGTESICTQYKAKFIRQQWLGYGAQKQFAAQQASHHWILSIDADEEITPALADEINAIFKHGSPQCQAYQIPFTLCFLGKPFSRSREKHLRLYDRRYGAFSAAAIHEGVQMQSGAAIGLLEHNIMHYSYQNLEHYFGKFNNYSSTCARSDYERGKRPCKALLLPIFVFKFLLTYVVHGKFRYGYAGFVWSLFGAFYKVVRQCKCIEMRHQKL